MKKVMTIIIAGVIAASMCVVFVGCGNSNKGAKNPTVQSTTVSTTTKPKATKPASSSSQQQNNQSYVEDNTVAPFLG